MRTGAAVVLADTILVIELPPDFPQPGAEVHEKLKAYCEDQGLPLRYLVASSSAPRFVEPDEDPAGA